MKKYLCLVMAALLVLIGMSAMAEETAVGTEHSFDRSVFEGLEGYKEDKFDKTWSYSIFALKLQDDSALGMQVQGSLADSKIDTVTLGFTCTNTGTNSEKVQALIGETVYTFDLSKMVEVLNGGLIFLSDNNSSFFEALANADEVSFRAVAGGKNYEADFSAEDEEFKKLQFALQEILRQGGTDCYSESGAESVAKMENLQLQVMTIN